MWASEKEILQRKQFKMTKKWLFYYKTKADQTNTSKYTSSLSFIYLIFFFVQAC